jgi:hypothetical protein
MREKQRLEERKKRMWKPLAAYEMPERNICATTSIIQLKTPFHIGRNVRDYGQSRRCVMKM